MSKPWFLFLTALFAIACESSPESRPGAHKLEKPVSEKISPAQLFTVAGKLAHNNTQIGLSIESSPARIEQAKVFLRVVKVSNDLLQISLQKYPLESTALSKIEKNIKTSILLEDIQYDTYLVCKDDSCKTLWLAVEAKYFNGPLAEATTYVLEACLGQDQAYTFVRIGAVPENNPPLQMKDLHKKLQQNRFFLLDLPVEDPILSWLSWPA